MTSNPPVGGRILGSLRSADGKGVVRMEDRFDTAIDDLWSAAPGGWRSSANWLPAACPGRLGHFRRPSRADRGDRRDPAGRSLAAVPHP